MPHIIDSKFLTINFLEWFDLNSNPKSLFERLSISGCLIDYLMCISI